MLKLIVFVGGRLISTKLYKIKSMISMMNLFARVPKRNRKVLENKKPYSSGLSLKNEKKGNK
jgi:hypothetical protein